MPRYNIAANQRVATPGASFHKGAALRQREQINDINIRQAEDQLAAQGQLRQLERDKEARLLAEEQRKATEAEEKRWQGFLEDVADDVRAGRVEAVDAKARAAGYIPEGEVTDEEDMAELAKLIPQAEEKPDYTLDGVRYDGDTNEPIAGDIDEAGEAEGKPTAFQVKMQEMLDLQKGEGRFKDLSEDELAAMQSSQGLVRGAKGGITMDADEAEDLANAIMDETGIGEDGFWETNDDETASRMAFEIMRLAKDGRFDAAEIRLRAMAAGLEVSWREVEVVAKEQDASPKIVLEHILTGTPIDELKDE